MFLEGEMDFAVIMFCGLLISIDTVTYCLCPPCTRQNPEDTQEMVQRVLDMATEESDNPDLRDRGFIYWRLLSTDPEAAKLVVLGEKVRHT